MLKKSTYIFLSILLCVPLLFIIYFSFSIDAAKPTDDTLRSLSVKTADGRTFDINDAEDLRLYLAAYGNAKKINESELLHDLSLETPATVTHSDTDSVYNYDYYMSTDPAACYYYDASDVLYRFDEADAAALITRREFSYLYEGYTAPTVTIASPDVSAVFYADDGAEWHFRRGDGFADGFFDRSDAENVISFGKDDALSLDFSVLPTQCTLTVYNGATAAHTAKWESFTDGESVSEKLFSGIGGKLTYANDTPLTCEITAEWVQRDDCPYYGSATYTAQLLFDVPVSCESVDGRLSPGEFTFVKLYNLNEGQTVTLLPDGDGLKLPNVGVHKIGEMTFIYLPVPLDTRAGSYRIAVIAGDEETSFSLSVNDKSFPSETVTRVHGSAGYSPAKADFEAKIAELTAQSAETHYWSDAADGGSSNRYRFVAPIADAAVGRPAFGAPVTDDPNLLESLPYRQYAVVLEAAAGTDVHATASGKVLYTGQNAYAGNIVVIDHGFGMLSIYENLSEITVSEGDDVRMNGVIGKTGTTGYLFNAGTRFSLCIEGVFVNPTTNYRYGISY